VLRREQRDQAGAPHVAQQGGRVAQPGVDRCLMGENTEATPAQETEAMVKEHVEAGLDV
jgi:hypothetical protein